MAVMERDCWLPSPLFECCRRKLSERESFTAMLMFAPNKNKLGISKETASLSAVSSTNDQADMKGRKHVMACSLHRNSDLVANEPGYRANIKVSNTSRALSTNPTDDCRNVFF
ncbi:hypothetical protein CAPTEDRAFT_189763 [Capitella teleta]|uniref:Uncharacterized protein n=1 Tax=Capitella teleta TaxID=283909 RepID=R7TF99_CAPTE|nr:hypothetical protein CAPTEDRAFT_189763 [Capitella teleta]|eukprot:ELT89716.1 hypothetical protein CAPTEDRAFT_189763 [Capitella teleta]